MQHFSADQNVTWTKTGGTFSGTTATEVDWTAPNVGGTYTIRATNGAAEFTEVTVTVTGVVPTVPSWGFEVENQKKVLLFEPDDGDRQTVTKGPNRPSFSFTTQPRPRVEFFELLDFWDAHYPGKKVYFTHPGTLVEDLWWIDSDLKEQWQRHNLVQFSFVLKRV